MEIELTRRYLSLVMQYITSRSTQLPQTVAGMESRLSYNLWTRRQWPYREVLEGETLFWFDSNAGIVLWKTDISTVIRFEYRTKAEAAELLRQVSDSFDVEEQYFKSAGESGYGLCYLVDQASSVNIPKPDGFSFPHLGWLKIGPSRRGLWVLDAIGDRLHFDSQGQRDDGVDIDDLVTRDSVYDRLLELNEKMQGVAPHRVSEVVERAVRRDRKIVRELKKHFGYQCQFPGCTAQIRKRDGGLYVEVAHIRPVRKKGRSVLGNLLVLCPNHHKEFDYGDLRIEKQSLDSISGWLNEVPFEISFRN